MIIETNTHTLHKRYQYNLNQIKTLLEQNNLMIAKTDECRTMVIIREDTLKQKIVTLVHDNQIIRLDKDPTDSCQKQNK